MMNKKVSPHQNVSPTSSTHFVPKSDGMATSGATISSGGGIPLRLSIAVAMASALIQRDAVIDTDTCAGKALSFADALIERYNKDLENEKE